MALFRKPKPDRILYDPDKVEPVIRRSICTGEMTFGFLSRETNRFTDYQVIRDENEMKEICSRLGVDSLRTIY